MSLIRWLLGLGMATAALVGCASGSPSTSVTPSPLRSACTHASPGTQPSVSPVSRTSPVLVGPRGGLPPDAPGGDGFNYLAILEPGLSRSGSPTAPQFGWLKTHGWHSIINLRTTDDNASTDFAGLRFRYLFLPVELGTAPTDAQMQQFLCFATDPGNRPVNVHDNSGRERVSTFITLYRYSADGWSMDAAAQEAKLYGWEPSPAELDYLQSWRRRFPAGFIP